MKRTLLAILACASLAACAAATHFQPMTGRGGVGYSELRIEPGRYRVTFQGGPGAPEAQVQDYALLRAADLALAEGYDWFRIVDRNIRQTGYGGASIGLGVGGMSFGRHSATGVGVSSGFPISGGPSLQASLEVMMGKGPRPAGQDVYDPRAVRASIGPRVV
ncbi:MAG: hypothetical protein JWP49_405 [Phenylobacterium sp.]|jgi:hypothetical protein|nr:hypothetical protein [Phenylobacterium sp.]